MHQVPQLSHIAIRARQARVLFVSCETDQVYHDTVLKAEQVASQSGGRLAIRFCNNDREVIKVEAPQSSDERNGPQNEENNLQHQLNSLNFSDDASFDRVLEQTQTFLANHHQEIVDPKLVGAKSANSAELIKLAARSNGLFHAPEQFSIPNFVLQAIIDDVKATYIEKLTQLSDKNLSAIQVEEVRLQTVQLIET